MSDDAVVARRTIPIVAQDVRAADGPACAEVEEPFALMVYGDSMRPEFAAGDVIIVEPGGQAGDGAYVVARDRGEWVLRRLAQHAGQWWLCALDPHFPAAPLGAWSDIRGVVVQKRVAGRRRNNTSYV